eukprot:SAG11_NODE_1059_length_6002_cov_2.976453_1_plen_308_part_00
MTYSINSRRNLRIDCVLPNLAKLSRGPMSSDVMTHLGAALVGAAIGGYCAATADRHVKAANKKKQAQEKEKLHALKQEEEKKNSHLLEGHGRGANKKKAAKFHSRGRELIDNKDKRNFAQAAVYFKLASEFSDKADKPETKQLLEDREALHAGATKKALAKALAMLAEEEQREGDLDAAVKRWQQVVELDNKAVDVQVGPADKKDNPFVKAPHYASEKAAVAKSKAERDASMADTAAKCLAADKDEPLPEDATVEDMVAHLQLRWTSGGSTMARVEVRSILLSESSHSPTHPCSGGQRESVRWSELE